MRKGTTYSKAFEQAYWGHGDVLDTFWRNTFASFVSPLAGFYRDPMSAGAQILSRYLDAPSLIAKEIASNPEKFGQLEAGALQNARRISVALVNGTSRITLAQCAVAFAKARLASQELDKLRLSNPAGFASLQQQRFRGDESLTVRSLDLTSKRARLGLFIWSKFTHHLCHSNRLPKKR
jgi:hypothetical protein